MPPATAASAEILAYPGMSLSCVRYEFYPFDLLVAGSVQESCELRRARVACVARSNTVVMLTAGLVLLAAFVGCLQ